MKPIRIKIQHKGQSSYESNDAIPTEKRALDQLITNIESANIEMIQIHPQVSADRLAEMITEHFGDDVTVRHRCSDGCYGSSSGSTYSGLTLFCHYNLFPERSIETFSDGTKAEYVNLGILLDDHAERVEIDPDQLRESMDAMGIEGKSDNTYNYLGNNSGDPSALFGINFEAFQKDNNEGAELVIVKFHCGGDPRGNYTDEVVYKFKDALDFYEVFFPQLELLDEEAV